MECALTLIVRYPSEDLNLWLWANGIKVLTRGNNFSVLRGVLVIHILFVIRVLYRNRTANVRYKFNGYEVDSMGHYH